MERRDFECSSKPIVIMVAETTSEYYLVEHTPPPPESSRTKWRAEHPVELMEVHAVKEAARKEDGARQRSRSRRGARGQ
ncbi:hypothetical protein E2562_037910 [Oryza meyeriana var. granulata]|uniref:Uncharacterized protein n=1 Tax=Oryza meyeriana var. granulata TaxID=110450 RepID=A0A6G1CXL4_9ORYZ|nr:hypothetical protein E2562_037910 [Oryza meyeriana var. granulata]